jgi:chromosomal replication initiation ATPase DnaA
LLKILREGSMTETYLEKLQKAHKARIKRIAKASVEPPPSRPATPEEKTEEILNRGSVSFQHIFKTICRYYNVSMLDIISARRSMRIALARHVIAYIASQHTTLSLPHIASRLGRDRSTIVHAIERIKQLSTVDKIAADIEAIKGKLGI